MKKTLVKLRRPSGITTLLAVFALALSAASSLAQDIVYVTTYVEGTLTTCPPACYLTGTYSTFGSTAIASPPGVPARTRCTYGYSADFSWSIQPTLNVPGGIYKIEVAHTAATTSADALVTATVLPEEGTLSPSCVNSPVFNAANGGNSWHLLGYITNAPGVSSPVITFAVTGGTVGPTSSANRLYVDAFKFTEVNPCSGVAGDVEVAGPLAANQTFVSVEGVDPAATNVTVYADGFEIGQLSSGIVAGLNVVTTTPLAELSEIKAIQYVHGCSSPIPGSGPKVGPGANPPVKAFLSLWKSTNFQGPIGASSSGAVTNYILKGEALTSGSQSAPLGGAYLSPDVCWQTVTFDHSMDAAIFPNSGLDATLNPDPFCALEALVFAIDTATGPFEIYVDQIKNGDVVIEDFEGVAAGTTNRFVAPNLTGTPSPAATYLADYNSALVSSENSFGGTNALRIQWQWANNSPVRWARILANATPEKRYPQLDVSKPITIRYLVLPVGEGSSKLHLPIVPVNQTKTTNETVTFSVTAAGEGPFTYQWFFDGAPLDNAMESSYTKNNVQLSDTGVYSVTVSSSVGCTATTSAKLTVTEFVPPPVISFALSNGTNLTLNWVGSFNLQAKTNLNQASWENVGVSTGPYTTAVTNAATFYRLQKP
jgi:hypothetical protein